MKVIIKDKFYDFQNTHTNKYFEEQKLYLLDLIEKHDNEQNKEALYTSLFSLYNLTEALIYKIVDEEGVDSIINVLNARVVNK